MEVGGERKEKMTNSKQKESRCDIFNDCITMLEAKMLFDSLDNVTWYNDLASEIVKWKECPKTFCGNIAHPDCFSKDTLMWTPYDYQLQVIWMILVSMFGDYGMSPRYGWINRENQESFNSFIDSITKTYQEHLRRSKSDD